VSVERLEKLSTTGATTSTTTTTSSKQPKGQTTRAELTTSRVAVNVVSTEVPKKVPELVPE
jgi:hypothetical protein